MDLSLRQILRHIGELPPEEIVEVLSVKEILLLKTKITAAEQIAILATVPKDCIGYHSFQGDTFHAIEDIRPFDGLVGLDQRDLYAGSYAGAYLLFCCGQSGYVDKRKFLEKKVESEQVNCFRCAQNMFKTGNISLKLDLEIF